MIEKAEQVVVTFLAEKGAQILSAVTDSAYIITLLGGSICIILYVAGWEKGMRWTGILFVCYILFRAIMGVI